jgi:Fic family protein
VNVYEAPDLGEPELAAIEWIDGCRRDLAARHGSGRVQRWVGGLRRMSLARNVQGSNSIEGYNASLDDVLMTMDGERPLDASEETALALAGYRDAMTYVLQVADDPQTHIDSGLLRSLHFMMLKYDLSKSPGRWRPGPIYVQEATTGRTVYAAPGADAVPDLIASMIAELDRDHAQPLVSAAMAHLNLVMIHPFRDGNGRMARCLQTLVLAANGITHPVFSSIEEYLGRNTPAYYAILAEVGQGAWHPERDARPWLRFCLLAHLQQAETVKRRFDEAERLWLECEQLALKHHLPERSIAALWEAARGLRIRRPGYVNAVEQTSGEQITDQTASRDLKMLVTAALLTPQGETRGRHYIAAEPLAAIWNDIRAGRPEVLVPNPFAEK